MPLLKGKKNIGHNIKTEMEVGKPRAQSIAIALDVSRKNKKKKMADGGSVSASNEKRPMPTDKHDDSVMISHNSAKKALMDDSWTDQPTVKQAQMNNGRKVMPIKRPKMVPSDAFSTRMHDEEADLEMSAKPGPYGEEPSEHDNEERPDRSGPKVPDMQDEHSNGRKPYAKGGHVSMEIGSGPEEDHVEHPEGLEEDDDQMTMPVDEYMSKNRMAPMLAEGGTAHEMDMQPDDEEHEEHHTSIAAAIMAKRAKLHAQIDSGAHDYDDAVMAAEGGEVDLDMNAMEQPNGYYDRNEHAALKENYDSDMDDMSQPMDSNEHGDSREDKEENKHDMISTIRSKMRAKRQFR